MIYCASRKHIYFDNLIYGDIKVEIIMIMRQSNCELMAIPIIIYKQFNMQSEKRNIIVTTIFVM